MIILKKKMELKMRLLFAASLIGTFMVTGCGSDDSSTPPAKDSTEVSAEQPDISEPPEAGEGETADVENDDAGKDNKQGADETTPEEDHPVEEEPETIYKIGDSAPLA